MKKALELPPEGCAALASSPLESLDDRVDPATEDDWKLEIARRIADLDFGKVTAVSWAEARRQVSAILNGFAKHLEIHPEALQEFKSGYSVVSRSQRKSGREFRSRVDEAVECCSTHLKDGQFSIFNSAVCVATVSLRPYLPR